MLATFLVETVFAIYMGLRYASSVFRNLVCLILLCLASFQLAEYQVCVGPRDTAPIWGRFGLIGITMLPALGMHLIGAVTRKSILTSIGYIIAGFYVLFFAFIPGATGQPECNGNYVIIQIGSGWYNVLFSAYYWIFILLAMVELTLRLTRRDPPPGFGFSRQLIALTLAGYLSFTVPMGIAALLTSEVRRAIPSVMCGFALILAIILTVYVTPLQAEESFAMKPAT
ncbi:MAG: hypothetical protein P4L46_26480 [Fimbriimonas sp.]|nr:hypothetical protein [Fimbriimonas sp.]